MTLKDPGQIVMTFGKHKGKKLDDVPLLYLDWLLSQSWFEFQHMMLHASITRYLSIESVAKCLEEELEKRDQERGW